MAPHLIVKGKIVPIQLVNQLTLPEGNICRQGERCDSLKFEKRQLVCVRRPKKRGRKKKAVNKEVLPPPGTIHM